MSLKDADALLTFVQGVFWVLTYIVVIRVSFRDRTYAMPLLAMSMNIVWEFLFTFIYPMSADKQQQIFNLVWFVLDLVILYTYLRFWRSDYPKHLPASLMWPQLILTLVAPAPVYVAIIKQFPSRELGSGAYTAYGDNLIMSVLFITMLIRRGDRRGQSLWIAWAKLLGTGAASLDQYLLEPRNYVLNALYLEILFFDLLYVVMLARAPRHRGEEVVAVTGVEPVT